MASSSAKSRMERILRLQEQIDEIKGDIRQVYAEEKADGGDKTAMGAAISYIRKRAKDKTAFDEREALASVYINAFEAIGTPLATHTHAGEVTQSYAEVKGADPKLIETVVKGVQTEIGRKALVTALDAMIEAEEETGEITEHEQPEIPANEIHERPSTNDKAYLEAVPQDEASLAGTGSRMLADREGRSEGEAASADLPALSDDDVPAFLKSKPGCLKLKDGHCRIGFETPALCSDCNNARMKARANA